MSPPVCTWENKAERNTDHPREDQSRKVKGAVQRYMTWKTLILIGSRKGSRPRP